MNNPFESGKRISLVEDRLIAHDMDDSEFLVEARNIVLNPLSILLLSGGCSDTNRYSIIGYQPFLNIISKDSSVYIQIPGSTTISKENPLDVIDMVFDSLEPDYPFEHLPFQGGAMGYLAYELKNQIEILPQTAKDNLELPDAFLMFPSKILIHDRKQRNLRLCKLSVDGINKYIKYPAGKSANENQQSTMIGEITSNTTYEQYIDSVRKIKEYILSGDIYQVNLSQRFSVPFNNDPVTLFTRLYDQNPAPFYSFINANDHYIISTSMERFLYQMDSYIETRPIKGTRKRGETDIEDKALRNELESSAKDDAELSMIVDLLRNDLGKVCKPSSVEVVRHREIEEYQNVFHTVSTVAGELIKRTSYGDLLRATFPGGSITGCPKIRAMEIIDELESDVRHVYTGSIGYFGFHGNLDLNIAIRTAVIADGICYLGVGGGIVHDSIEEDEYQETLQKGKTFFDVIKAMSKEANS
jgi:para-aminobenzoate synthetase component 1